MTDELFQRRLIPALTVYIGDSRTVMTIAAKNARIV